MRTKNFHVVSSIIFLTIFIGLLLHAQGVIGKAFSFTMSNSNWIIDFANLNMTSGKPRGANYKVSNTVGQIAPGLYSGTNYTVRAGFQYVYSIIPFRFSIAGLTIDFGAISPTNPVTRTNTLTISNGTANGYNVYAYENHALTSELNGTGNQIPDATCDNGLCTENTSTAWSSSLSYGLGYRCDNVTGTDCGVGFGTSTFYKQFANNALSESGAPVMKGTNVGRTKVVQITYKVNISGTQPPGDYFNYITHLAVPTF